MKNPTAVLDTTAGTFKIELFEDKSPITAGNFKKLASEGFYDGTRFHRVIANFMVQGGDPLSKDISQARLWGTGNPGYAIQDEFIQGLSNLRGTIAMANSGPNSGGSQFFINVVDNTYLDWDKPPMSSKHPVFGKVIEGMEVVDAISRAQTVPGDRPAKDIIVNKVTIQ
ncbi:peptidylprolyl isomerase [Candidatus Woesearchaeota archaeon]|nr:peptidylprolyl isomerase [Candidatus Woesearchaeota archaeon]